MREVIDFFKARNNFIKLTVLLFLVITLPFSINIINLKQTLFSRADITLIKVLTDGKNSREKNGKVIVIRQPNKTSVNLQLTSPLGPPKTAFLKKQPNLADSILNKLVPTAYANYKACSGINSCIDFPGSGNNSCTDNTQCCSQYLSGGQSPHWAPHPTQGWCQANVGCGTDSCQPDMVRFGQQIGCDGNGRLVLVPKWTYLPNERYGPTNYDLYRNGQVLNSFSDTSLPHGGGDFTSYLDYNVTAGTTYSYTVVARTSTKGNLNYPSSLSLTATFNDPSCPAPTPAPTQSPTPAPTPLPTPSPTPFPTPSPTIEPTPLPTLPPPPPPTPEPTPAPTPLPTVAPTQSPTPVPINSPTPIPTNPPTPLPTGNNPIPTQSPTSPPTPLPTQPPTNPPTPRPTNPPTPLPTQPPTPAPVFTTSFKISENPVDIDNAPAIPYTNDGMVIAHELSSNVLGTKTVFIKYLASDGTVSPLASTNFELVPPDPLIKTISCKVDLSANGVNFELTGANFGDKAGTLSSDQSALTVTDWNDQDVKANLSNPPQSGKQTFSVTLTRPDGPSDNLRCSVGISDLLVKTSPACSTLASLKQRGKLDNVEFEAVDSEGNKQKGTISIDENGRVQGLATKLTQGKKYRVALKVPSSLRRTVDFTASGGSTTAAFTLPLGDIYPLGNADGAINTFDYEELKREWGFVDSSLPRPGDLNGDGVVNSHDWSCMVLFFNQQDDPDPTTLSPAFNASLSNSQTNSQTSSPAPSSSPSVSLTPQPSATGQ